MLPGVLLLVAAAEAGAAAAVEAGEATWTDSLFDPRGAGGVDAARHEQLGLLGSVSFRPRRPADGRRGGGSLSVRFVMARVVVGLQGM